jgi:hypothetical protein
MLSDTRNSLIDTAIWVGYFLAVNLFSKQVPVAVAVGVASFLFSFVRSSLGLVYRGVGAPDRVSRDEREGLTSALVRSAVIGVVASSLVLVLASLGWL